MSRQGAQRSNSYGNVREFWQHEAKELGRTPIATIRDVCFRNLEILYYRTVLPRRTRLLDIGCGNGHGTLYLHQPGSRTVGVDYTDDLIRVANEYPSNPKLQRQLRRVMFQLGAPDFDAVGRAIRFRRQDLLSLKLRGSYDLVVGQRILINLVDLDSQLAALHNVRGLCPRGARLYLTEATVEGHAKLDRVRKAVGLEQIEKYWHNHYVSEAAFKRWPRVGWRVIETTHFDVYMLLSKVVYPAAVGQANCRFLSPANRAALMLSGQYRTWHAAKEIGLEGLLERFSALTAALDPNSDEPRRISAWAKKRSKDVPRWKNLGHQKVLVAQAV